MRERRTVVAAERQAARRYQANTERRRRVLSLVTLGRRILATSAIETITPNQLAEALRWHRDHIPRLNVFYVAI